MPNDIVMRGTIQHMYRNCPKPDGWFGCFFKPQKQRNSVPLTGITNIGLRDGMDLQVKAHIQIKNGKTEYVADEIFPLTTNFTSTVKYLSGPDFPGIGVQTVEDIYFAFGDKTLSIIENEPEKLKSLNIPDSKIEILHDGVSNHNISNTIKKIMPWAKLKLIKNLIIDYDNDLMTELKKDPYFLCWEYGVDFMKADAVAELLGIPADSNCRIRACIYREFRNISNKTKDSFLILSNDDIWNAITNNVVRYINRPSVTQMTVSNEIQNVMQLVVTREYNDYRLYDANIYQAEKMCASIISKLLQEQPYISANKNTIYQHIANYEQQYNMKLDDRQKEAVVNSLKSRISVITGGPGRGKTAVIKCILYIWRNLTNHTAMPPILAAPTGKAVKRIEESVHDDKYQLYGECSTVATLVTRDYYHKKKGAYTNYGGNLLIVDESSMLALEDAGKLLSLAASSQVIFVGDFDQLPSIAIGSFFKDICESPYITKTKLETCYRANSVIISENADNINKGIKTKKLKYDPDKFMIYPQTKDDDKYVEDIISLYKQHLHDGLDFNEICVLCPMRGYLTGVNNLNIKLQELLNPSNTDTGTYRMGETVYDRRGFDIPMTRYNGVNGQFTRLRIGDKVIFTENCKTTPWKKPDKKGIGVGIFNGDTGIITEYHEPDQNNGLSREENEPFVKFVTEDGRIYEIDASDFNNFILGYAMTIHKSQGCEYKIVILSSMCALDFLPQDIDFASRNLIYTAVTRAKDSVEIVGSIKSLDRCIDTLTKPRNSLLLQRIADNMSSNTSTNV